MSKVAEVVVLVEGKTEQIFVQDMISPYLAAKQVYLRPVQISKPGQKGGDVKFARVQNDIRVHLKQRPDTFVTLFVDYYGIKSDWPGVDLARKQATSAGKAAQVNDATKDQVNQMFQGHKSETRFIPYVAMYEFEALLFSEPDAIAEHLQVSRSKVDRILEECGEPEEINDSPDTAPSKRLKKLSGRFRKTTTGIAIARAIGLAKIRERCPIFDKWISEIEAVGMN